MKLLVDCNTLYEYIQDITNIGTITIFTYIYFTSFDIGLANKKSSLYDILPENAFRIFDEQILFCLYRRESAYE